MTQEITDRVGSELLDVSRDTFRRERVLRVREVAEFRADEFDRFKSALDA